MTHIVKIRKGGLDAAGSRVRKIEHPSENHEKRIGALEQALAKLESQNRELLAEKNHWKEQASWLNSALVGYAIIDLQGIIHEINPAGAEMFGVNRKQLLQRSILPFLAPRALPLFLTHLKRCRSSSQKVQTELFLRDGQQKEKPVDLWSVRRTCPATGRPELRTFIFDVSERYTATQELSKKQHDYEVLLNSLEGAIWEIDPATRKFTFVSEQAERLLRCPSQWWMEEPDFWMRQLHPEDRDRVISQRKQACLDRKGYILEYRMLAADGRTLWLKDSVQFHKNPNGEGRLCGITVNITVLKEIQAKLQAINEGLENRIQERTRELEESLRSMEGFCYSIAHNLRAPTRAMEGFATALMEDYEELLGPEGKEYTCRIIMASRRMDELIGDLLAYGKILHRDIPCVDLDLAKVVHKVLTELKAEIDLAGATVDVDCKLPRVSAHEHVLHQVLTNLMTNAIKFVAPETQPVIHIKAEDRNEFVRICIEDNGIGIVDKHLERIFHVFERLHCNEAYSGTGIGLALVKKGVERMGGTVGVESEPNKGSRFWIELRKAVPATKAESVQQKPSLLSSKTL